MIAIYTVSKMKKRITSVLMLILLTSIFSVPLAFSQTEKTSVIVVFKDNPRPDLIRGHNGDIQYQYKIIPGIACSLPEQAINALRNNPNVLYIEENIMYTASEVLPWGVDRIDAEQAHLSGYTGSTSGEGVNVAILDTGIDYEHPDLINNYIPDYWWSISDLPMDHSGHGTHCAGIVAAVDNEFGVIGVAPDADIHAVKVLNSDGVGYLSDIILGIEWSVANDMQVISMSLGSDSYSTAFETACDNAYTSGVVLVAAAGNDYARRGKREMDTIDYPAGYDSVIAVGATDQNDLKASFSSTGSKIELAAPGVNIYSTIEHDELLGYDYKSGTSMACPHVSGVVALMLATPVDPIYDLDGDDAWDPSEVRAKLHDTADDLGDSGWDNWYGYGLVDAEEACGTVIDTVPPDVSELTPEPGSTVSTDSPVISARVSDPSGIDPDSIIMTVDGLIVGHSFDGEYVSYSSNELADGSHTVDLTVSDNEGYQATRIWSFNVDTSTPGNDELIAELGTPIIVTRNAGRNLFVWAETVVTVTGDGVAISGATVYGYWVSPPSEALTGITDANGQVIFMSPSVKNPTEYPFTFVLENIVFSGWVYTGGEQTITTVFP